MARVALNYEKAAEILAYGAVYSKDEAVEVYSICPKTYYNYTKRLETDTCLANLYTHKRKLLERDWGARVAPRIENAMRFMDRAFEALDAADPKCLHAVMGAFKLLADGTNTHKLGRMIDADIREVQATYDPDSAGRSANGSESKEGTTSAETGNTLN